MFRISGSPINPEALKTQLAAAGAGACVTFEGWVRDHNEGKRVRRLEYEAFVSMAEKEGACIVAGAREKFGLDHALCIHRVGTLEIGQIAVWVGASAPHRDEAFAACRYIIDEVKHRVPIWKKEHYIDGDSGWVHCEHCAQPGRHHAAETTPGESTAAPRIKAAP
ncbi:MAG: molybdenum cofactor biosynthesis protein MoaE [Candidatus Hydrogenedentes bacterium]|nr:molybdenum cofactor biosynthesis protein MoaE [Candidatus Hydrogenedentota bacterium]MBI3119572.1 molybdenum cofactor biosynthesis protein MoaE [Candidatus Hydrogenedentota bacterium]